MSSDTLLLALQVGGIALSFGILAWYIVMDDSNMLKVRLTPGIRRKNDDE